MSTLLEPSATTSRAAATATTEYIPGPAESAPIVPTTRRVLDSLGGVVGFLLLVPRLNLSLRERGARPEGGAVQPAERSVGTAVGYISDTQCGEFRGRTNHGTGEILFESQNPARIRVSVSVNPQDRRPVIASPRERLDEQFLKIRRFPSVTLAARSLRLFPDGDGTGVVGILTGTLDLLNVKRPVDIPIAMTIEGTVLRGEGRFSIDLKDLGMTAPRLRGLEVRNDITIEVCLLVAAR